MFGLVGDRLVSTEIETIKSPNFSYRGDAHATCNQ